jgi:hypothetical protein
MSEGPVNGHYRMALRGVGVGREGRSRVRCEGISEVEAVLVDAVEEHEVGDVHGAVDEGGVGGRYIQVDHGVECGRRKGK